MADHQHRASASSLLVVEGHAACPLWPAHLGAAPEGGWAIVEQEEWESLGAFSARLNDVLSRAIALADGTLSVTLVTSRHWDPVALDARRRLALDILAHLARGAGGALILTHGHQHDAACHESLTVLTADLAPEWSDARIAVSACVAERPRRAEQRRASSPSVVAVTQATT